LLRLRVLVAAAAAGWDPSGMKLVSRDGGYAELRVVAYEFETPPVIAADDDDNDAGDEWLVVRGSVRLGDNREWAFTGPYLTITEARRLGAWLASAGAGRIAPSPASPGRHLLGFTEPNLALSIAALSTERASVRVHFSHESMPPWHQHHDWPDYHAYFILLDISTADLTAAAKQWDRDLQPFPARTGRHAS
jgi:hypothetical protein